MWIACSWIFCDWNHFEFGQMWLEDHSICSVPNRCFTRNKTAPPRGCLCLQRWDFTPISPIFHHELDIYIFLDLSYNSPTERDERLDPSRLSKMIRAENFVDRDMWESIMAENKLACQIGWSLADNNQLSITKIIHILDLKATDLGL